MNLSNTMQSLVFALIAVGIFYSCSSVQVAKRQHRPGWHVDFSSNAKSNQKQSKPDIKQNAIEPERESSASIESTNELSLLSEQEITHSNQTLSEVSGNEIKRKEAAPENNTPNRNSLAKTQETKAQNEKSKSNFPWSSLLLFGPAIALGFPFKRVSRWGAQNKLLAQISIAGASVLLGVASFYAGVHLRDSFADSSSAIGGIAISMALVSALIYPFGKASATGYAFRKTLDAALLVSGVVSFFSLGLNSSFQPFNFFSPPDPSQTNTWLILAEIGLILLALAVFFILMVLLIALACNLSCAGNVVAGTIVSIGGVLILLTLLVLAIRAIHRGLKKKRERFSHDEEFEPLK
ncbi:MAG: hypothetical protein WED33_11745 [Bacteroidia bacterium]